MTESFYWILLLMVDGVLMFMGLNLIFGFIPDQLKGSAYHVSRRLMGWAFTALPIAGFLFYLLNYQNYVVPFYATAVNLTAYCAVAVLISGAFATVLSHKFDNLRTVYLLLFLNFLLFLVPVWGPIVVDKHEYLLQCHIVANIWLVIFIVSFITYGCLLYFKAVKRLDDFYSDDVKEHLSWMFKALFLFVGLGVIAAISPFSRAYSRWLSVGYLAFQMGAYLYIYRSARRYEMSAFAYSFAKAVEDDEFVIDLVQKPASISAEVSQTIKKGVDLWIQNRGFTIQGVTLKSVAADICTNLTYLSTYINSTYKCSFKVWVTTLRIDEAKKMLHDTREFSVTEIASKAGFASSSSFIHTFRKAEGVSPSLWREQNKVFK